MKPRRQPLARRTPLRQGTPLERGGELKRTEFKRSAPNDRQGSPRVGATPANGPVKVRRQKDTGPTKKVRAAVKARAAVDDVPTCEVCGAAPGTNIHHRQPRGSGGCPLPYINAASNLLMVCGHGNSFPGCHSAIENGRDHARDVGWLVPRPTLPIEVPVLRRGVLVLLDDEGGFTAVNGSAA